MTGRSRCEHYTHKPASRQLQESELCRHTRADVVDPEHRACSGALGQNSSGCRSDIARTRNKQSSAPRKLDQNTQNPAASQDLAADMMVQPKRCRQGIPAGPTLRPRSRTLSPLILLYFLSKRDTSVAGLVRQHSPTPPGSPVTCQNTAAAFP